MPCLGQDPFDLGEQDRALRPAEGQRRVVLSSSIAETSLTVPGVRIVVDGGWRRSPVLDPGSGLTRLQTLRISRAAAEQRAGRAGREGPGVAIRLWTEAQHRGLAAFDKPEILDAELARGDDKRPQWVYRIHGRLNKLRRRREVADLV